MAGRVLEGRYRLEARLEEGGMGAIWRAQHLVLCAPVAVKLIDPEIADDRASRERFIREAQAAAALRSPHVVQILDYGVDGELPFIVMELLEGENLAQRIRRTGQLTAAETARIVTHVARAIGRAHEAGIVHRDLKPENVFLVHNDDDEVAKVLDFGVAKGDTGRLGPNASRTRTGSLLGTPYYMSPEQAQGNKTVDFRSDLWSLGVIAFECLTAQRPFFSDGLGDLVLQICVRPLPVPSAVADVPAAFDAWFARAVARDPAERFSSAREMAESLREALGIEGRETVTALPERRSTPTRQSPSSPMRQKEPRLQPKSVEPSLPRGWAETAETVRDEGARPALATAATDRLSPTLRQFGTTSRGSDPGKKNGTGVLLLVAGGALAAGVVGGLMVLDRWAQQPAAVSQDAGPLLPTPAVPAARQVRSEPVRSRSEPAADPAPANEVADAGVEGAEAAVDAAASKGSAEAAASDPRRSFDSDASTGSSDAGTYVKPAWARPDPEPPPADDFEISDDNPY